MRQLIVRLSLLALSVLLIFGVYRLLTIRPLADTPYFADQPFLTAEVPDSAAQGEAVRNEGLSLANANYLPVELSGDGLLRVSGADSLSLQQALTAQPERRAVVVLQQPDLQGVAALLQALDAADARPRVLAVVDDEALSRVLREQAPDLATATTSAETEAFLALQRLHLAAFHRPVAPALLLPPSELSAEIIHSAHSRGMHVLAVADANAGEMPQPLLDAGLDGWIVVN